MRVTFADVAGMTLVAVAAFGLYVWVSHNDAAREQQIRNQRAKLAAIESTFLAQSGASFDWMDKEMCSNYDAPLYEYQRAIRSMRLPAFEASIKDIIEQPDGMEIRAQMNGTGRCLFAPKIEIRARLSESQMSQLASSRNSRFDDFLLAVELEHLEPQENRSGSYSSRQLLVSGRLLDFFNLDRVEALSTD